MFNGTENYDDDYFKPLEQVGATDLNGTTNFDRTNYFENVPTSALDLALWMESDRMGHLLGAVTQERLDEQRGVVQNEKRQGENRPYGRVAELYARSFPPGHPYRTLPIGSMADLDAATLDDVREWFRTYYGPANAVLVLAGDIDVPTARAKAEQYFGHIAPGPAVTRPGVWIAARTDSRRETMYDQVRSRAGSVLEHAARQYPRLRVPRPRRRNPGGRQDFATVRASRVPRAAGRQRGRGPVPARDRRPLHALGRRQTGRCGRARRGRDDGRIAALHRQGPTKAELERAKIAIRAGFVRGLERIGGFGGKADVLASCEVFAGDPGCYRQSLEWIDAAKPADLQRVARVARAGRLHPRSVAQPPYVAAAMTPSTASRGRR